MSQDCNPTPLIPPIPPSRSKNKRDRSSSISDEESEFRQKKVKLLLDGQLTERFDVPVGVSKAPSPKIPWLCPYSGCGIQNTNFVLLMNHVKEIHQSTQANEKEWSSILCVMLQNPIKTRTFTL